MGTHGRFWTEEDVNFRSLAEGEDGMGANQMQECGNVPDAETVQEG